jgi:hypothetical protein
MRGSCNKKARATKCLYVRRELIILDASFHLISLLAVHPEKREKSHTVSIEACKKLRASRPTQTLSIEKSPLRIIEEPP